MTTALAPTPTWKGVLQHFTSRLNIALEDELPIARVLPVHVDVFRKLVREVHLSAAQT
jgi:hypothetical protein